jgi:TonB family protein
MIALARWLPLSLALHLAAAGGAVLLARGEEERALFVDMTLTEPEPVRERAPAAPPPRPGRPPSPPAKPAGPPPPRAAAPAPSAPPVAEPPRAVVPPPPAAPPVPPPPAVAPPPVAVAPPPPAMSPPTDQPVAPPAAEPPAAAVPPAASAPTGGGAADVSGRATTHGTPGVGVAGGTTVGGGTGPAPAAGPSVGTGGGERTVALATPGDGEGGYGPYLADLRRRLQQTLSYPATARRRGLSGTVHLDITVDVSGRVSEVVVARSSSERVLDEAALEAARGLARVPFPPDVRPRPLRVRLPVVFELR